MSAAPATTAIAPTIRSAPFAGWDATSLEHGPLTLILVPQVGGRVMSVNWHGHELSFVNPKYRGHVQDVSAIADVHACKRKLGFLLWGGEKTWLAPQDRWSDGVPFIDLDSGAYDIAVDAACGSVRMTSPVCRETGVRIERTVRFGGEPGAWRVTHRLTNASDRVVNWAPWDVDMVLRPATVFMPTRAGSVYPRGVKTFDNEGVSAEVRDAVVGFVDDIAVVTCKDAVRFKYGVDADIGRVLAVIDAGSAGLIGYRKSVATYHPQPYGHGCVLEVYNAPGYPYVELEVHGPVVTMKPGESFLLDVDNCLFNLDAVPENAASIRQGLGLACPSMAQARR